MITGYKYVVNRAFMDPITQGVVGAALAQTKGETKTLAKAGVIGALAGMAPDLDVLMRSSTDPLFVLEYHRQFTHSLLFIPFGALICALVFYPLIANRWQLSFKAIFLWSFLGFATHGLLDGCTSYGTLLLWPFTDHRFSWDIISVIDPLFTLPLLVLILLATTLKSRRYLWGALVWGAVYLSIGFIQHERVLAIGHQLAAERGHQPLRLEAKPSFANLAVWKLVYETEQKFYVDAVKPGLFRENVWVGSNAEKISLAEDFPWLDPKSQQAKDIQRFGWFSSGYLGRDPQDRMGIVDIRYSLLPHQIAPLWGIQLSKTLDNEQHINYFTRRENRMASLERLIGMFFE
jgi:inner membrane protein